MFSGLLLRTVIFNFILLCHLNAKAQNTEVSALAKQVSKLTRDTLFIRDSIHLPKALELFNYYFSSLPNKFIYTNAEKIPAALKANKDAIEIFRKIKLDEILFVGDTIPDFKILLPDGELQLFSKAKANSKLVLLDFWASWCLPCRDNSPELKKLVQLFSNHNFSIFSLSLDKDNEKWLKAIGEDDLTGWPHGRQIEANQIDSLLGIYAIPRYYLLDSNMKLIGKFNGRWDGMSAIKQTVDRYFEDIEN